MFRFFVVGLGGSGGKTIQFLMERLRRELKRIGWQGDHLPQCWQFLHLDTPTASDGVSPDLPPVVGDLDGRYAGFVNYGDTYGPVNVALQQNLNQAGVLSSLYRWIPRVNVDIQATLDLTRGASQYRAVGRVAGLAKTSDIFRIIDDEATLLNSAVANEDMRKLAALIGGTLSNNPSTLVFIVSSLAGGTGSSMVLDVANLLRAKKVRDPWFGGDTSTAILYTSELFTGTADLGGVEPNSLAAISEIVNARSSEERPWMSKEWAAYGLPDNVKPASGRGPLVVFPIGKYNAITGAMFGDGEALTIYQGVASALASIMLSEAQATSYNSSAIGNLPAYIANMKDSSHWTDQPAGAPIANVGFSGIGMASVDLGRDRYREYAAQRIAADAMIDLLLEGHKTAAVLADPKLEDKVLKETTEQVYPQFLAWAGFPAFELRNIPVIANDIWSTDQVNADVINDVISRVFDGFATAPGSVLAEQIRTLTSAANPFNPNPADPFRRSRAEAAHRASAEMWFDKVQNRIEAAMVFAVAQYGIQVGMNCAEMMAADLDRWSDALRQQKRMAKTAGEVAQVSSQTLQNLGKGQVGPASQQVADAKKNYRSGLMVAIRNDGADLDADLIAALKKCVVIPLATGLKEAQGEISLERAAHMARVNTIETYDPSEWPRSDDDLMNRFEAGANEHLLVQVNTYPELLGDQLEQLKRMVSDPGLLTMSALRLASYRMLIAPEDISDRPPVIRPDETLGRDRPWRPKGFGGMEAESIYHPFGNSGAGKLRCATWMLQRSRQWVERPNTTLASYCNQGLQAYLDDCAVGDPAALNNFVGSFQSALADAAPLAKINPAAAQAIHGKGIEVGYQFSYMPSGAAWGQISREMTQILSGMGKLSPADADAALTKAQTSNDKPQRIDIISLYTDVYSPLIFSSLTDPVAEQWGTCTTAATKRNFWLARRGRQLHDVVPVSPAWLRSFLIGWFIGRLTGEIRIPATGSTISVLSDASYGDWSNFDVLLGVSDEEAVHMIQGKTADTGYGLDAIAVLLESLPLAWNLSASSLRRPLPHLEAYLAVKALGDVVNQNPPVWHESPALKAWFDGTPRTGADPRLASSQERVEDAIAQMTGFRDYFAELCNQTITERDFWTKPRHWELREQLLDAAKALVEHLSDPGYSDQGHSGPAIPRFEV